MFLEGELLLGRVLLLREIQYVQCMYYYLFQILMNVALGSPNVLKLVRIPWDPTYVPVKQDMFLGQMVSHVKVEIFIFLPLH